MEKRCDSPRRRSPPALRMTTLRVASPALARLQASPQDQVLINSLPLCSSSLALQAQQAANGHDKVIVPALRATQTDKLIVAQGELLPSVSPMELAQPLNAPLGADSDEVAGKKWTGGAV